MKIKLGRHVGGSLHHGLGATEEIDIEAGDHSAYIAGLPVAEKSATITVSRINATAPGGVFFTLALSGFVNPHPVWDFGDNLSGPYTVVPAHMQDSNSDYGAATAHVYAPREADFDAAEADTIVFQATCTVYDLYGPPVVAFADPVTIHDPRSVWSEAQTAIVAPDGVFTGAPNYGTQITTDDLVALVGSGYKWLRLKPGHDYTRVPSIFGGGKVDSWDPDAAIKPNIEAPNSNNGLPQASVAGTEMCSSHVRVTGSYGPSYTGTLGGSGGNYGIGMGGNGFNTAFDVEIRDVAYGIGLTGRHSIAANVSMVGYKAWGVWSSHPVAALIGCDLGSDPLADGYTYLGANIGAGAVMRVGAHVAGDKLLLIKTRWSGSMWGNYAVPQQHRAGSGVGDGGQVDIRECLFEVPLQWSPTGKESADSAICTIEGCVFLISPIFGIAASLEHGGTTFRNNILIEPYAKRAPTGIVHRLMKISNRPNIRVYNNTGISFRVPGTHGGENSYDFIELPVGGAHPTSVIENNLLHAPFMSPAKIVDGLDLSHQLDASRFSQFLHAVYQPEADTSYAVPETFSYGDYTDQPNICLPVPTGALLTAGSDRPVPAAYFGGALRNRARIKGAVEPDPE